MRPLGVVTGSRLEARCLRGAPNFLITCSGADAGRARQRALQLIECGVGGLISFGLAGGLDPALEPGDLLVPENVLLPSKGDAFPLPCLAASAPWRHDLLTRCASAGLAAVGGSVLGSERIVDNPARKADLHRSTGAVAVDTESHVVASEAEAAGLPWLVLRGVADPAGLALPAFVPSALGPDGKIRTGMILRGLLRQPRDLSALVRLGVHSRRALRRLSRAGRLLER